MKKSTISRVNTAVILAAGMGIRLRNVIGFSPKGMLKVDGKSIIVRSLESLKKEGIKRVVIVTGFQESKYIEYLQPNNKLPKIEFIHSPRLLKQAVCIHSLWLRIILTKIFYCWSLI